MNNNNRRGNTSGKGGNGSKKPGGSSRTANDNKKSSYSKPGGSAGRKPFGEQKSEFAKKPFSKRESAPKPKVVKESDELRLNRFISNSGMCSRRDADIYISSGNVKVNGQVVTEMGYKVKLTDKVEFDGTVIIPEKKEYILLNKPKNFTTTGEDDRGMRNAFELVKMATKANIQPVGRMDKNTTGLLIYTNDTAIVRKFAQPNQKSFKIYQVSLDKNLKFDDLEKIASGVTLDGHRLFVDEISYIENEPKTEIGLKLRTPNVKVVRAIFEQMDYNVLKVDRVSFAGLTKKNLPRGNWRFLTDQEVINLKNV